uniref:Uncharacterized protein n=1 Tax=Anopheles merus TaxID=30066 RepID=A0A182V5Z9_ANOME
MPSPLSPLQAPAPFCSPLPQNVSTGRWVPKAAGSLAMHVCASTTPIAACCSCSFDTTSRRSVSPNPTTVPFLPTINSSALSIVHRQTGSTYSVVMVILAVSLISAMSLPVLASLNPGCTTISRTPYVCAYALACFGISFITKVP